MNHAMYFVAFFRSAIAWRLIDEQCLGLLFPQTLTWSVFHSHPSFPYFTSSSSSNNILPSKWVLLTGGFGLLNSTLSPRCSFSLNHLNVLFPSFRASYYDFFWAACRSQLRGTFRMLKLGSIKVRPTRSARKKRSGSKCVLNGQLTVPEIEIQYNVLVVYLLGRKYRYVWTIRISFTFDDGLTKNFNESEDSSWMALSIRSFRVTTSLIYILVFPFCYSKFFCATNASYQYVRFVNLILSFQGNFVNE